MGDGGGEVELQHPAGDEAAAGDMAGVVLAGFADIDEGEGGRVVVEQVVEAGGGDGLGRSGRLHFAGGGAGPTGGTGRLQLAVAAQLCRAPGGDATAGALFLVGGYPLREPIKLACPFFGWG